MALITTDPREDALLVALAGPDDALVGKAARALRPADLADLFERLDARARRRIFAALEDRPASVLLEKTSAPVRAELLASEDRARTARLLDRLPMDNAVSILGCLREKDREDLLARMTPAQAADARSLLAYPPKTAGRLMSKNVLRIDPDATVARALDAVRERNREVETVVDTYVIDREEKLAGVVSLRDLMNAPPTARVAEIMATDVVSVRPETSQRDVALTIGRYDFLALPVVDRDRRLLGIVMVDDVVDVLNEEATHDQLRLGGVEPGAVLDAPYFSVSIAKVVRSRIGWLLLLFLAETLTGTVLRHFEDSLSKAVALSFFIPLLIGTGGNAGSQTVSTIIRALALREVLPKDAARALFREMSSGALLGLLLGGIAFGRTLMWHQPTNIAIVVAVTVLVVCTWANTIGSLVPLVAARLRLDPTVMSAPLITTLVDATGLFIYFSIARAILPELSGN